MDTPQAILRTLESPNVSDSNLEPANVVDVLSHLAHATARAANAITPPCAGADTYGGHVESLTEAVMGMTKGLQDIAGAIENLALAVSGRHAD
jgi:hypothetical protein